MNSSIDEITFDTDGICCFCTAFLAKATKDVQPDVVIQRDALASLIQDIRQRGRRQRYDCVIGVSGGVDSSWVLVQAVQQGLRPLAVHMDNGWNSELAQNNIANLVRNLGVDLHTHVINWHEYRGLMQAFFDADVIDVELLYDNAMFAVNYRQAAKHGVHYILGGMNHATEGMPLPSGWNWAKFDKRNIKAISRRFGGPNLRTFPSIGLCDRIWFEYVRQIRWIAYLDYLQFKQNDAVQVLQMEFGYKPYPYKHYESIFTRFYQGYLLPRKFRVDKRLVHLSTLVLSGEITRDAALEMLAQIPFPSISEMETDRLYFLKKMGWTDQQLNEYLNRPSKSHGIYGSSYTLIKQVRRLLRRLKK